MISSPPSPTHRRPRIRSSLLAVSAVGLLLASVQAKSATAATRPMTVSPQSTVVMMFAPHAAFRAPRLNATVRAQIPVHQPITGERTELPVVASVRAHGARWLKVELPGRPNGATAWIRARMTSLAVTPWHVLVNLGTRTVTLYLNGHAQRSFRAVVGKPSTPTPTGTFFVQETVSMPANASGGPYALALSARSNVLQEFEGGPGQIAIHGRNYLGGRLGDAQSHGCVRLATSAITYLAERIGPGVPVTIVKNEA